MALTLLEAVKSAPDDITAVVIEEYASSSDILQMLPFRNIEGSGEHYNREDTLPGVGFRGINEGYDQSTGVLNPQSEALKTAGGDLDVDRIYIDRGGMAARSSQELRKVKSLSLLWTKHFIKGDSSLDPRGFDGIQLRATGSQLLDNAAAGAPLSLNKLDEAIDQCDEPSAILMNKSLRRRLTQAARNTSVGGHIEWELNSFGDRVYYYQGLPICVIDYDNENNQIMPFTEASGNNATTNNTSIYIVSFGEMMLSGIQGRVHGQHGIHVKDLGELQTEPKFRTRVEWDVAITAKHGRCLTRLRGIQDAEVTV
jgi:hypothetical protein